MGVVYCSVALIAFPIMFNCAHCHKLGFIRRVEKDASDFVVICSTCHCKNILAIRVINQTPVPLLQTLGWREQSHLLSSLTVHLILLCDS